MVNLILPKCDLNLRTRKGYTALAVATINNRDDIVRVLLASKGVDIDVTDSDGNTALHHTCLSGLQTYPMNVFLYES